MATLREEAEDLPEHQVVPRAECDRQVVPLLLVECNHQVELVALRVECNRLVECQERLEVLALMRPSQAILGESCRASRSWEWLPTRKPWRRKPRIKTWT